MTAEHYAASLASISSCAVWIIWSDDVAQAIKWHSGSLVIESVAVVD
ncbi:hypothetical protein J2W14_000596 [Pseudarthrobacter oxydans]|nr:hypothetical protein [Pseudarthrobacter oxydans]MDP9981220.1 hypothetical protein [Pseudarthrobacter oxydans]